MITHLFNYARLSVEILWIDIQLLALDVEEFLTT